MPTTFIHTGDAHVDATFHGGINPATGIDRAWESNRDALASAVEHALSHDVDAFIHAGDAFKHGRPSAEAILMFVETLAPLAHAGIPIVLIDGNHERLRVSINQRTATTAVGEALARHGEVHVRERTPGLVTTSTGLQVACLPWLSKATVLTRADAASGLDPAAADRFVVDQALGWVDQMCDQADSSMPLVLASHVTVDDVKIDSLAAGSSRGSEVDITHVFNEPILPRAHLEASPVAYAALSHIHARQRLGTKCFYSGSPNRLTFTDADDPKSVNLVTLDDNGDLAGVEHLETAARPMTRIDLGVQADRDRLGTLPEGTVLALTLEPGRDQVASEIEATLNAAGLRLAHVQLAPPEQSQTGEVPTSVAMAETTDPSTALDLWMEANDVPHQQKVRTAAAAILAQTA